MAERLKTRARVNIKPTNMKQGYRPDFTVEIEWAGDSFEDDEEGLYRVGKMLDELERRAFAKVNEMNVREGFPLVPTDTYVRETEDTNGGTRITDRSVDPETGEIFP